MSFLISFLFIIGFIVLMVVLNFGFAVFRLLFRLFQPSSYGQSTRRASRPEYVDEEGNAVDDASLSRKNHEKVFSSKDGEYIDFEEIE